MAELVLRILRHALDFQAQDLQLFHYPRHTIRYHTQVFTTYQHRCTLSQHREFLHRFVIPELVVALVVIMVVQAVECFLFTITQTSEDEVALNGNAWVVCRRILAVWYKQDIANQRIKSFFHQEVFFVFLTYEPSFHLALSIVFRTHFPNVVMTILEECILDKASLFTEYFIQDFVVDERTSHEILLEMQTKALDFFHSHWQCRNELTEQTVYRV